MSVMDTFLGPLVIALVFGLTTFVLSLWYSIRKQSYWKERNVPFVKPLPFLGSLYDNMVTSLVDLELKRYKTLGPVYGHYEANRPLISVADPKLLRDIFVKDFVHFPSRRSFQTGDEINDKMISILEGEDWKRVRSIISPTFSTGKLKRVLGIFKDCSNTIIRNFKMAANKKEPVNAKKLFGGYTMDVIASSAFSTKIDSHNDPENEFVRKARVAFTTKFNWRLIVFLTFPKLLTWLKVSLSDPSINGFFRAVTEQIVEERKRTKQKRNDFLQLMIDAVEETGTAEKKEEAEKEEDFISNYGQESDKLISSTSHKSMSMNELVAQCVIFFLAGYETTASTLSFCLYQLAIHEDVQEKTREEIAQCLQDTDGELTYETMHKMKYLDNVISETLRICPPAIRTERKAASDVALGDTGILLQKDMIVTIPIYALHHDPKYFPEPEKFDPDRFNTEEKSKRDSYVYLPFGHGPRNCVGLRFALLEIKVCLVYVLSCFNIKTCPQTKIPLEFNPNGFGLLQPKDILVDVEARDDCLLKLS